MTETHALQMLVMYVPDPVVGRCRDFYVGACGWPVSVDVEGYAELDAGVFRIGIWSADRIADHVGNAAAGRARRDATKQEFYVRVADGDVPGAFARALAAGGIALRQPEAKDWGDTVGYVLDPAGQVLALSAATVG